MNHNLAQKSNLLATVSAIKSSADATSSERVNAKRRKAHEHQEALATLREKMAEVTIHSSTVPVALVLHALVCVADHEVDGSEASPHPTAPQCGPGRQ